jgi:hypothetical protein
MLSRTTRILLVVAALAGIAYLLFGRNRDDRAGDGPERLAPFEIARVDGVVVQRESETLRFVREDSLWRMIEPVADGAERNAVVSLLDALSRAPVARNLGATEDLARFGLDSPIARVTLLAGVDTLLNTAIGKRTVDEAWCYALRGTSNDLLLVPTDIARAATLPVDAYRSRRVVDFGLQQVDSFAFHTGGQTSRWARRGRGWYTVEKGDTVAGDSVAVESVLRRLRGLRIASFLEATHASDSDRYFGIDVWGQGRFLASAMFWCGNTGCQGGTTRPGHSFVVEDDLGDLFALSTTLLRERRLLQFSPPDAARIDVTLPNVEGSLVRRAGAWS